jgi:hypothetical protein
MRLIVKQVHPETASGDYDEFYAFRQSVVAILDSPDAPLAPIPAISGKAIAKTKPDLIEIMSALCVT